VAAFLRKLRLVTSTLGDFDKFASYYNGPGQAAKYGGWIGRYYDDFKKLSA